jgi:AcrR family transcriptional regulator
MPRSGKESRARLRQAAFELFLERGFNAVTTSEIADRAGVTERTYFRHFPDKREVLFDGESQLAEWVTDALAEIPDSVPPLLALRQAFRSIEAKLESNRTASEALGRIIAANPALWERAAAKEARLVSLLVDLLRARGIDEETADIAARTGWGVLAHATLRWQANPASGIHEHVELAFSLLHALTAVPLGQDAPADPGRDAPDRRTDPSHSPGIATCKRVSPATRSVG